MHRRWLSRKYRLALSPEQKKQFELKVLAESIFKGISQYSIIHGSKFVPTFADRRVSRGQRSRSLQPYSQFS
jgi:myosin-1